MKEDFLKHIWENKLFFDIPYETNTGDIITIIHPGISNKNAGPDYFNAKIKFGSTLMAGNVEFHVKSSDWYKHNHHHDPKYNNVILQVVHDDDIRIFNARQQEVPTVILDYPEYYHKRIEEFTFRSTWIACEPDISTVDRFVVSFWLEKMAIERLRQKTDDFRKVLIRNKNNWHESFYQSLTRSFGFGINSDSFEILARNTPYHIVLRHSHDLEHLEALFFGQAGFLNGTNEDQYILRLQKIYSFLVAKYKLSHIDKNMWNFLRLRPNNFPTIRIAQLAALLHKHIKIFDLVMDCTDVRQIIQLFESEPSEYWAGHFVIGRASSEETKRLGENSILVLIINTVAPFLYLYGEYKHDQRIKDKSVELLESIAAEKNHIITRWAHLGIVPQNSLQSQALIYLRKEYCLKNKCMYCQIGNALLVKHSSSAVEFCEKS